VVGNVLVQLMSNVAWVTIFFLAPTTVTAAVVGTVLRCFPEAQLFFLGLSAVALYALTVYFGMNMQRNER